MRLMPNITADLVDEIEQGEPLPVSTLGQYLQHEPPTLRQWQSAIEMGRPALAAIRVAMSTPDSAAEALLSLFGAGLDRISSALDHRLKALQAMQQPLPTSDKPLHLFDCGFDVEQALHEHLAQALPRLEATFPGLEFKVRRPSRRLSIAIYVPGLGSLESSTWRGGDVQAKFVVGRTNDLQPQMLDDAEEIELAESLWIGMNSCMALSSEQDKAASIKALNVQGRLLAISGTMTGPDVSEATAWALVDARQWKGQTTYISHLYAAYDNGSRQRGDMRGLLVTQRGKPYVFARPVVLVDYRPYSVRSQERQAMRERDNDHGASTGAVIAGREQPLEQMLLF